MRERGGKEGRGKNKEGEGRNYIIGKVRKKKREGEGRNKGGKNV